MKLKTWDYTYCKGCKHLYCEDESDKDTFKMLCDEPGSDMYVPRKEDGRECKWRRMNEYKEFYSVESKE